ncbi:dynein regulatory complex subunit 4-like [Brachyistius frenatus]|uniref:dynein regulatory complex subunit 4-like n=1 Tax=Brachyistius frenatus TaxID=100188 RepID=UPI0037E7C0BE
MPPKTKPKGKSEKKKDVPTKEMVKDQLWEELLRLQEELNSVRMKKNLYKSEMHEAHGFCHYAKKNLEVTKNRMREKLRLKQEAGKQRRAEIEEHELKLRHLNAEHHNDLCEVKTNAVTTTSDMKGEQLKSKLKLQGEMQRLQALKTDQRFQSHLNIRNLQLKQQNEVIELLKSYSKKDTGEQKASCMYAGGETRPAFEGKPVGDEMRTASAGMRRR